MKSPKIKIKESPLFWPVTLKNGVMRVLDETLLPRKMQYIQVSNAREAANVIHRMKTRAFGQFLVVLNTLLLEINNVGNAHPSGNLRLVRSLQNRIKKTADALNKSRPTFPFAEV